jgi:hypothetical protein
MGIFKYRPSYPIITTQPTLNEAVANLGWRDYVRAAVAPVVAYPLGYLIGKPFFMKPAYGSLFGTIAFAGAVIYGIQGSTRRLQGVHPNQDEVARYPFRIDISDYQVRVEPFRTITEEENLEIRSNPRF